MQPPTHVGHRVWARCSNVDEAKRYRGIGRLSGNPDQPLLTGRAWFDGNDDGGSRSCRLMERPGVLPAGAGDDRRSDWASLLRMAAHIDDSPQRDGRAKLVRPMHAHRPSLVAGPRAASGFAPDESAAMEY